MPVRPTRAPEWGSLLQNRAVKLLPMKVLLVSRGEPFSFAWMGFSSLVPPFIFVQATWVGPAIQPWPLPGGYSVYVLPCAFFHELKRTALPTLCLVYGEPDDALACLEAGAADFLREGWNLHELGARLFRLWRPEFEVKGALISMKGENLHWVRSSKGADSGGESEAGVETLVDLTPGGATLLRALLAHRGCPVSAGSLEEALGCGGKGSRALAMQISRLRSRLSVLETGLGAKIKSCGGGAYCIYIENDD